MKKNVRRVAIVVLLAVFLFSVGMMVRQQLEYWQIDEDNAEAAEMAGLQGGQPLPAASAVPVATPAPEATAGPEPSLEPLPQEAAHLLGLDLAALREVNGDVFGWIEIPGTSLSYPLVQGADNQYYLNRSWKNRNSSGGSIFLECTNNKDLTDFHTIIYGHRMRNDSMFGTLKYYNNLDFWREHPNVYIVRGGRIYRYEIFAAQEAWVTEIIYRLDLDTSHLEEEFLQYCIDSSVIDTGVTPDAGARFLTLSTCTARGNTKRWVVHAVLQAVWSVR